MNISINFEFIRFLNIAPSNEIFFKLRFKARLTGVEEEVVAEAFISRENGVFAVESIDFYLEKGLIIVAGEVAKEQGYKILNEHSVRIKLLFGGNEHE